MPPSGQIRPPLIQSGQFVVAHRSDSRPAERNARLADETTLAAEHRLQRIKVKYDHLLPAYLDATTNLVLNAKPTRSAYDFRMAARTIRYRVGNEHSPTDPWGRSELVIHPDGTARLDHFFSRPRAQGQREPGPAR